MGWNVRLTSYILAELQHQWEELFQILSHHLALTEGSRDRPLWEWDPRRTFSVKNAYFKLNDGGLRRPFAKVVWYIKVPLKIRAFLWLIVKDALPMWDNLMKRKWQGLSVYALCMDCGEYINHLFTTCAYTTQVWGHRAHYLAIHIPQLLDQPMVVLEA